MEAAGSWGSRERNDFWRGCPREGEIGAMLRNIPQKLENREENRRTERGRRWGNRDTPHPESGGGAAGGQRRGRSEGFQEVLHPSREPAGPLHPALSLLTWELEAKESYCWAPGLFPAPFDDMAADELSQRLLRSPAALVETPLPFRPASLCAPLPAGPPATAEHRARAAREEARRADNHRVHSPDGPSPRQSTHSPPATAPGRK